MGDLQCTLEFSVELHKFINVDLFQRGFYQIRTTVKLSPKLPAKIEVSLPKNSTCSLVFPACVVNGTAVSKTFQILYKNEEVVLDDLAIFKVHILSEGHKIPETLLKSEFQLGVELWFTDQTFRPDQHNSIHCVSSRTLLLHFDPSRGLHHHLPLLFDYFHLCAVTITIHASILAVCQPYLSLQRQTKQTFLTSSPRLAYKKNHSSMETVLFGPSQLGRANTQNARLYRARLVHWEICNLLLSAHNSLCRKLMEYMTLLPPWQQLKLESLERASHLDGLSDFAKECHNHLKNSPMVPPSKEQLFGQYKNMDTDDDILVKANSDIAQMCGALILIWQQFLEIVVSREKIRQHLSRQRHFQRVKRFSEAFFIIERSRDSALSPCDSSVEAYQEVSETLRRSLYLNLLPPLEVECIDLDGDFTTLPVVFEEHFQETARRGSSNSQSSQSESNVSLCEVNLSVDESIEEKSARRNSQGSLGQKARSPDISATPTSPSAFSWCPEAIASSPVVLKSFPLPVKKHARKDKFLNNFKLDFESDCEDYSLSRGTFSRLNNKITVRSKIKLRSKTVNFLRQLKKPHFNQGPNSVVLLGVKKLDGSRSTAGGMTKASRMPFSIENGIRHSQSTLSVMSTLCTEGKSLSNSESMPDLTIGIIPPPPPPPRSRFASSDLDWAALDLSIQPPSKPSTTPNDIQNKLEQFNQYSMSCLSSVPCSEQADQCNTLDSRIRRNPIHSVCGNEYASVLLNKADKKNTKKRNKSDGSWRDDVFIPTSNAKSEFSKYNLPPIVTSQPEKIEKVVSSNGVSDKLKESDKSCIVSTGTDVISESVCEVCPPSPPVQFRDPPKDKSTAENRNDITKSTAKKSAGLNKAVNATKGDGCLSNLCCRGTVFFPKPPAQFACDDSEESTENQPDDSVFEPNEKSATEKSTTLDSSSRAKDLTEEKDLEGNPDQKDQEKSFVDTRCTILEMLKSISDTDESVANNGVETCENERYRSFSLVTSGSFIDEEMPSIRRASVIGTEMISFVKSKEEFRKQLQYSWLWYSDFPSLASTVPYFQCDSDLRAFSPEGMHLVICVHGLDGNSADLRLVRTYLELGLPTVNFEFLMSERNQGETFDDFDALTDRLVSEITYYIEVYGLKPSRISFIGHSLGNIIIRSALTRPEMKPYLPLLHTFLSLSGPHLGTLYNNSGLVNMGMWFMQKWKKSGSLLQLAMKDASDLRDTFLYKLSKKSGLEHFQNVLLFGSSQDRYVPLHSARIEMCKAALKDFSSQGKVYREMVTNLIQPIIDKENISLLRYDVHHALPSTANSLIGRAAHIAVLDSELFIEKFLSVCGLRYFC